MLNVYFWDAKIKILTLIKSISGIRGTIGGTQGDNLSPIDIVEFAAAFGSWVIETGKLRKIVIGRDGRISGAMVSNLVCQTLIGLGIDVVDLGLSTTPTVEMAVPAEKAGAGIILTASHNPKEWNALKFLNEKGEFISGSDGARILEIIESRSIIFSSVENLGSIELNNKYIDDHIDKILALKLVDVATIKNANFNVVVDCINSTGAISIPPLLDKLGVKYTLLNDQITGDFAHNPEPLAKHLKELSLTVVHEKADFGISVDPDVDRLAFVCEDGSMFGEEYTLVAVADYVIKNNPGNTVSNLSSTRALRDITESSGLRYTAAAVGEVNVVKAMKNTNAVIGGEGNGGIIYPELHYGRDALVGIALFLSHLAQSNMTISQLLQTFPKYTISKHKISLTPKINVDSILETMAKNYSHLEVDTVDGVKIYLDKEWVHLRKSNTEPIIRVYTESKDAKLADGLAERFIKEIKELI